MSDTRLRATKRERANAALYPTAALVVRLWREGHRGRKWQDAMPRLETLTGLLDPAAPKGTTDA